MTAQQKEDFACKQLSCQHGGACVYKAGVVPTCRLVDYSVVRWKNTPVYT